MIWVGSRIAWCFFLLFGFLSLISCRERVNVQVPTDNPLKAKLGFPLRNGGFERKGFNLWDPSIIKVGDTYHMFASCWTSEDFNAWKTSFIVRGTSKTLLGLILLPARCFVRAQATSLILKVVTIRKSRFITESIISIIWAFLLGKVAWR